MRSEVRILSGAFFWSLFYMIVQVHAFGPFGTNSILLGCEHTRKAVLIDAPLDSKEPMIALAKELSLSVEKVLLTHSHWDHIADAADLKEQYHLPIYVHSLDQENLTNPGSDGLPLLCPIKPVKPDDLLVDQECIYVGNLEIYVIHTPGHSPGCVCFYLPKEALLISGDTLFKSTIGNLSFPTSRPNLMWQSLEKLVKLPPVTRVIPGHGDETTLQAERELLMHAKQIFGGSDD